jgi:HEPN domain-containing protein
MVDINKQVLYWIEGAVEELTVAGTLFDAGKYRHALFFAHLALEKGFKAVICRKTGDIAPRMHNLTRLAEIAALPHSEKDINFLAEMNLYNLEGRYPSTNMPMPDQDTIRQHLSCAEEMVICLKKISNE